MKFLKKRVNCELKKFIIPHLLYLDHEIQELLDLNYNSVLNIFIYLKNNDILLFKLGKYYPFKPPDFLVNEKNYKDLFLKLDKNVINFVEKECCLKCICCDSVLCENNWSPNINIVTVINEYLKRKNTVKKYYLNYLIQRIITNNNINEFGIINHINSYLIN